MDAATERLESVEVVRVQIVNGQPSEEGLPIVSHQPARGEVYVNEGATIRIDDEYGIGELLKERPVLLLEISWRRGGVRRPRIARCHAPREVGHRPVHQPITACRVRANTIAASQFWTKYPS